MRRTDVRGDWIGTAMTEKRTIKRRLFALSVIAVAISGVPAAAQFFPFFQPYEQQPQQRQYQERREPPVDYSRAPAAKKWEQPPASSVVVMGDSLADWLAYGLEEAFSDTPEIGIVRKHKPYSGLIRYESRGDLEWSSVARDIMNTEKPAVAVMLLGLSDRGPIRERAAAKPAAATAAAPATVQPAETPAPSAQPPAPPVQPQTDAEGGDVQIMAPETPRGRGSSNEFRSEVWAELYSKKIADTIAAMKSRGVPVLWVGLPAIRGAKSTSEAQYLNGLYRAAAEKAGVIYVDVWDGFVDEDGKFAASGPDVDGQTRRLRSPDGVYFTKYGARKLAHFAEREIRRVISARAVPVALPVDSGTPLYSAPRPGGPVARPVVGAVVPLTAAGVSTTDDLLGGSSMRPAASDPIAARVLVKGEPVAPLKGRADDFVWQGNGASLPTANMTQEPGTITPVEVPVATAPSAVDQKPKTTEVRPAPRRPRPAQQQTQQTQRPPAFFSPFGFFR